jgi:hypothetical protein
VTFSGGRLDVARITELAWRWRPQAGKSSSVTPKGKTVPLFSIPQARGTPSLVVQKKVNSIQASYSALALLHASNWYPA